VWRDCKVAMQFQCSAPKRMANAGRIKAVTARAAHRSHVDDANAESTVSGMHGLAEATEVPARGVMKI
jgi:hypothetical protein